MPAPPVEPSTMTRVPDGPSRTERVCRCPASTSGTDPSSGGTAYGSWTAATATGRSGCFAFQLWMSWNSCAPARTSGSGEPSCSLRGDARPVPWGAGVDGGPPGAGLAVAAVLVEGLVEGLRDMVGAGLAASAIGAVVSGVNRGSPMPAKTMPLTSRTSPSSTTAFGFWATACWVRLESWLPRTKTYGTPTSLIRDSVDDSTS